MHGLVRCGRCLPALTIIALVALVATPGCSRHFFRTYADKDVEGVITQKNIYPDWEVKNWHVYPDPRSRFADMSNPDRPPYPPDDPAARLLSPNPQRPTKKSGVGRVDGEGYLALLQQWDAQNRATDGVRPPVMPPPMPPQGDKPAQNHNPAIPQKFVSSVPVEPRSASAASPALDSQMRPPAIVVVGGEVEQNGKIVPAVTMMPVEVSPVAPAEVKQPPERLPEPQPLPVPKPVDPKGDPVGKGGDGRPGVPGDPAADYLRALESNQVGYRITLEQAIELGLVNAREFQDRREDLYLASLDVTFNRFTFAAQAFLAEQIVRRSTGRELPNAGEFWQAGTTASLSKLFPTGAMLLVQYANQIVINLASDRPTTATGNLSLGLVQPFLRGGGKAVTLEPLTLSERNLVYAIRSYARFRKIFFVAIAAAGNYTNNPYGLQGLAANLGRGIGGNLTAPSIGYLPLIQQQALINNQRKNVASLERLLRLYQAFREGGQQSPLQVGQVELSLLNARANLLGSGGPTSNSGIRGYLDGLDNFKLQLGLPVTVPLELDDAPLRPIREQLGRFDELFAQARAIGLDGAKYDRADPVAEFRKRWLNLFTASPLVRGTTFAKEIETRWATWAPGKLTDDQLRGRLEELRETRRKLLAASTDRENKKQPEPPAEVERLLKLNAEIDLGEFEEKVRAYEARPWLKKMGAEAASLQDNLFTAAFNAFYLIILEAQNERLAQLYRNWPDLAPLPVEGVNLLESSLDDAYTVGVQAALSNRLDLMNARGLVVDAWRSIAVTANSLQGVFDVRYDLNSSTPQGGNNPFAFSADRSSHQLTFRTELPLVRRAERNNYRAALISYQRQRRTLMAFEDNIANDVRSDLRQLRTLAELYLIQKRTVELNYAQVDNAEAVLFAPPVPGAGSDAGSAAALTQQVLNAQSGLLNAQNTLYTIWVQYLTARMTLYLDLEQMQLDDHGVWCDEFFNRTNSQDQPGAQPPARPNGERLHAPRVVPDGEWKKP